MARSRTIRVYPDGDVWVVKKADSSKASAIRNTQREAYEAARNIALNQNLSITVCGPDGRIQRVVSPREARDNNCFITTACVKYYGLSDDCYQLETLRKFRDTYLSESSRNKVLVKQYYSIAPRLVELLESDKNRKNLFNRIFEKINLACIAVEQKKFSKAKSIYQEAIVYLLNYFKNVL